MADAITIERRGIPAAIVAIDRLANTTGRAMARAQGIPDYPIAIITWNYASMDMVTSDDQIEAMAREVAVQCEAILLGRMAAAARAKQ